MKRHIAFLPTQEQGKYSDRDECLGP